MEPTKFTISASKSEGGGRTLHTYTGGNAANHTLMVMDNGDRVDRFVEVFFWDGPIDGVGRRDAIASVSFNRNGTEVDFSGGSFHLDYSEEAADFLGALRVAAEWFHLFRFLAVTNIKEVVHG